MAKIDLKDYLERLEGPVDREALARRVYQKKDGGQAVLGRKYH